MSPIRFFLLFIGLLSTTQAYSSFIETPDVSEVPELEESTLLRDMDIPNVRERDPDPQSGPRLSISEFRLQGILEYPEYGIYRDEIAELVEGIRFDMMGEHRILESGYTLDELAEVSDLLAEIEDETSDEHIGPLEVQRLVFLVREQRRKRGITVGMIETVADRITQYYRDRGFILAKAYIPEQKVRDGVVTLTMLLGVIGNIEVANSRMYRESIITKPFANAYGKPVTSWQTEERLYLVNDLPGISVQGFFEPGYQVGDTELNINVIEEDRFSFIARADNHGTEDTGEYRLYGEVNWNNPSSFADHLQIGVLQAFEPGTTTFGNIAYDIMFFSPRARLFGAYSRNAFDIESEQGQADLNLEGETDRFYAGLNYVFKRSRQFNFSMEGYYENLTTDIRSANTLFDDVGGNIGLDEEVDNLGVRIDFDILQQKSRILHEVSLNYVRGELVTSGIFDTDELPEYDLYRADYTMLTFLKIPFTSVETRLILRSHFQYTDTGGIAINKQNIGGAARARGYTPAERSAEQTAYVGLDWIFNAPAFLGRWQPYVQPLLFVDYAYARELDLNGEGTFVEANLSDAGAGVQINVGAIRGNLLIAVPTSDDVRGLNEALIETDTDTKVLFEAQYQF